MVEYIIAAFWGFAEATFFFLIPDIYLTRVALLKPFKALQLCFFTAFVACCGGSIMYLWGSKDNQEAYQFLTIIPAIYPKLIHYVVTSLQTHPFYSLFFASFKGIPYKIYAVALGANNFNYWLFLIVGFSSRLFRFLVVTGIVGMIAYFLKKHYRVKTLNYLHLIAWVLIYIIYFTETYYRFS